MNRTTILNSTNFNLLYYYFTIKKFIHNPKIKTKGNLCELVECLDNTRPKYLKVTLTGATNPFAKIMALMLKQCPLIDELALYDEYGTNVKNVSLDLSHIDTRTIISAYEGIKNLRRALLNAHIVAFCGGYFPAMALSDEELFELNSPYAYQVALDCTTSCPQTMLCIVTPPVSCLVPMVSEVFKKHCIYDFRRIFGVTSISSMRANTLVAVATGHSPQNIQVPLCGGPTKETLVPVLSNTEACKNLESEHCDSLTKLIKEADETICKIKGKGASDVSLGFAASRFVIDIVSAIRVKSMCVDSAFVRYTDKTVKPRARYLCTPLQVGLNGIEAYRRPILSPKEKKMMQASMGHLRYLIGVGESYVTGVEAHKRNISQQAIQYAKKYEQELDKEEEEKEIERRKKEEEKRKSYFRRKK